MNTRAISTSVAHSSCDVCGRTMLRGEQAQVYIEGGNRHSVCELCTSRALHTGWVREGTIPEYGDAGARIDRRRSLLGRLRSARARRWRHARTRRRRCSMTSRGRCASSRPRRSAATAGAGAAARLARPAGQVHAADAQRRHPRAAPRARRADQHRAQDLLGGRAVQRLRAPPYGRRDRPLAGDPRGLGAAGRRACPASSTWSSPGSCAGIATRSTFPTRCRACGSRARVTSSTSSPPRSGAATRSPTIADACRCRDSPLRRQTFDGRPTRSSNTIGTVIYCVVPQPLADDLMPRLTSYYSEDPNVSVIVDRRRSSRREGGASGGGKREVRDRRRPRIPGELPELALD